MIITLFFLILATVSSILYAFFLMAGGKYRALYENLDSTEYFLKDTYGVGFAMNNTGLFRLRGQLERDLKKNAKLVWDNIYYEYYANLAWAQFLSLGLLILAAGSAVAALAGGSAGLLIFFVAILFIAAVWNLSVSKMKEAVAKRRDECVLEFPNMVSKLSLLINSGMVLREAWYLVAGAKDGPLYELMRKACEYMDNGESDVAAIHRFGVLSDSIEIKKFTSAMVQGIEKGNSELSDFLVTQAAELWAHKRQLALQKGEIAAGKLIIPLGLMFGGIILIIVAAAMQSMSF